MRACVRAFDPNDSVPGSVQPMGTGSQVTGDTRMRLHGMVTEGENMPSFQLACECPAELVGDIPGRR